MKQRGPDGIILISNIVNSVVSEPSEAGVIVNSIIDAFRGDLEPLRANLKKYPNLALATDLTETKVSKEYALLHMAVDLADYDISKMLIESGANVNSKLTAATLLTPLSIAARNFDIKLIKLLLNNGASLNLANYMGQTVLNNMIYRVYPEFIEGPGTSV